MAFTTWTALETEILNDMADQNWTTKSYAVAGRSRTIRDVSELEDLLNYVRRMKIIAGEGGAAFVPRTYAKPRSGGRW